MRCIKPYYSYKKDAYQELVFSFTPYLEKVSHLYNLEKYFSSLESTYNFYTLLTKNYKTLSTYHPKKQGLFRVVKLEEKKEDFSVEDIRNAFKYIDSSSK